jgi:hypothetical protein
MTIGDEELIAWNGDGLPPAIENIRQRIDQLPRWQTIGILQGWWPILVRLDQRLREVDPTYQLTQVKQKFGSLDVHMKGLVTSDAVRDALNNAEAESRVTCEVCGRPGSSHKSFRGWIGVYCDEHRGYDDEQRD